MIKYKLAIILTSLTLVGCANTTTDHDSVVSNTITIGETSNYKEISWENLPLSMQYECDLSNGTSITLTGFLSSQISYDKSTAYCYNTHVDLSSTEYKELDSSSGVKLISLDLSSIVNYSNAEQYNNDNLTDIDLTDGLQFVKIYGDIIKTETTDVFGSKQAWHIKVKSIEITKDIPNHVKEYESFALSDEYEALNSAINHTGEVLYNQTLTEEEQSEITSTNDYDITATIKGISDNYPEIYADIKDSLTIIERIVLAVDNDDSTIGSSGTDYDTLLDAYINFIEVINKIGLLE